MRNKLLLGTLVFAALAMGACEQSATEPTAVRPQFEGGNLGDPCDPATYQGPYRCIPDPNHDGGYIIAY